MSKSIPACSVQLCTDLNENKNNKQRRDMVSILYLTKLEDVDSSSKIEIQQHQHGGNSVLSWSLPCVGHHRPCARQPRCATRTSGHPTRWYSLRGPCSTWQGLAHCVCGMFYTEHDVMGRQQMQEGQQLRATLGSSQRRAEGDMQGSGI